MRLWVAKRQNLKEQNVAFNSYSNLAWKIVSLHLTGTEGFSNRQEKSVKNNTLLWHLACGNFCHQETPCSKQGEKIDAKSEWSKGIRLHLSWSATSTKPGFSNLRLANWKSFLQHVANKHANHPDPHYQKCNYEELPPRKWIKIGELSHFTAFNTRHAWPPILLFCFSITKKNIKCNR